MKRINYFVTEGQIGALKALSERTGLSVSELIRRAIDRMIEAEEKKANRRDHNAEGGTDR